MDSNTPRVSTTPSPNIKEHVEPSLKGTLLCVILLGSFIGICWLGVFLLFLNRQ